MFGLQPTSRNVGASGQMVSSHDAILLLCLTVGAVPYLECELLKTISILQIVSAFVALVITNVRDFQAYDQD